MEPQAVVVLVLVLVLVVGSGATLRWQSFCEEEVMAMKEWRLVGVESELR